jgi:hypothetical protein
MIKSKSKDHYMQTAPFVTDLLYMLNFDFCWLVEPLIWALGFMLSMLAKR